MTDSNVKEVTIEITNYCPNSCKYCSANAVNDIKTASFIKLDKVKQFLGNNKYKRILISGGEPLSHPDFYNILQLCYSLAEDVIIYSNAIKHICFNVNVIDNIYVEANVTVGKDVNKIHILKRTNQGREYWRPEAQFSGNFDSNCECKNKVLLSNGEIAQSPCKKNKIIDDLHNVTDRFCSYCFHDKLYITDSSFNEPDENKRVSCGRCNGTSFYKDCPKSRPKNWLEMRKKYDIERKKDDLADAELDADEIKSEIKSMEKDDEEEDDI